MAKEAEEKKKIEVDPDVLQQILDNQEALKKDNELLRASVSSSKLAVATENAKPKKLPQVFLKVFMGKPVVSWKSERNEYVYIPGQQAPAGEVLKSRYFFLDGTDSGVVDQIIFTREDTRVWGSVLEDKNASILLKLERLESADENLKASFVMPEAPFEIRKDFVNP